MALCVSFYARWSGYNTTGIEKQKKNIFLEAIVYFIGTVGAKDWAQGFLAYMSWHSAHGITPLASLLQLHMSERNIFPLFEPPVHSVPTTCIQYTETKILQAVKRRIACYSTNKGCLLFPRMDSFEQRLLSVTVTFAHLSSRLSQLQFFLCCSIFLQFLSIGTAGYTTDPRFCSPSLFCTSELAKATGEIIWIGTYFLTFYVTTDGQCISIIAWTVLSILVFQLCQLQKLQGEYGTSLCDLRLVCWYSFRFGIGLTVGSAGANKRSSYASALTGQMPLFFKPLAAFAIVPAFPHIVQKSELI